jgi:hypothetical protein
MAGMRNSAGINKASGKNVNPVYKALTSVTSYVGNVGRELRDIPTAIGAPKRMQTGNKTLKGTEGDTGKQYKYTVPKYKGNASSGIKAQLKEAAAAITAGQKGTSVGHTSASGKVKPRRAR